MIEKPLRLLIVEDSEDDVAILIDEVRRGGYLPVHERVADEAGLRAALEGREWDLVLCDHNLPRFDSVQALRLLNQAGLDLPFVIVSGRIGEKLVVSLMKAGAADYVRKDDLSELLPVIERALRDSKLSSERRRAHEGLQFLADVSGAVASSLDLEVTLRETARLVVGHLADVCIVDVAAGEAETALTGVAHVDPRIEQAMRAHRFSRAADRHPIFAVTGWAKPQVVTAIEPPVWEALGLNPALAAEGPPIGSALFLPLVVHERRLGAIGMARQQGRRVFDDVDLQIAGELARRAAAAVDHAFLYQRAERARASAETANRLKDEFLAIASHELRTPMTSILGYTRLLMAGALPRGRRANALEIIDRNASLQAKLLDELADFARMSSGKLSLQLAPVELAEIAETALQTMRPVAEARDVTLEASFEDEAATSVGDASRLEQVITNLLNNAVRFTPRGGRVQLTVRRDGEELELRVSDSGDGIQPEFLPFVFERFRQGKTGPSRSHGGLGLGLAIVKHLVELHRGQVEAQSDGLGKGATFVVRLPLAGSAAEVPAPRAPAPVGRRGAFVYPPELVGLRVLVVDDDEGARRLLDGILAPCRVEVVIAASVAEAIEAFGRAPPDLLVSDISMPGETGWDLIRHIRELPRDRGGRVPAVALSAYARDEDRAAALSAGFTCFLVKPIDPQEFVVTLSRVVSET